jgi:hypothetical protein
MRSMVEGACGAEISREAEAPSTAFGRSPFPRFAGQDKCINVRKDSSPANRAF